jgi:putative nucleotidyltransferase with HDIG domain
MVVAVATYMALITPLLTRLEVLAGLAVGAFLAGGAAVAFADRALSVPAASSDERAPTRPTPTVVILEVAALLGALGLAPFLIGNDWDLGLLLALLVFSVISDQLAVPGHGFRISGSFLALVLAMVFLGGGPACVLGVLTIFAGWIRWRERPHFLLNNLLTYALFPLLGGWAFQAMVTATDLSQRGSVFAIAVFALFWVSLGLNFLMSAGYSAYVERTGIAEKARLLLLPVLQGETVSALIAVGLVFLYVQVGLSALVLFAVVLTLFEYMLSLLLVSQERCEALELRTKQLQSFQVGTLSTLLRMVDMRDDLTARHSASVAFYARATARRLGYDERDQELVHVAALLHDIGKFVLADRILNANVPLREADWIAIRRHPVVGARLVSSLEGYGPVAEIILRHHERIDGSGYPAGLSGDEIPPLAQIIAVAESYDAMTTRDSYRTPVSPEEALAELRRVAGRQFDASIVEGFARVIEAELATHTEEPAADYEQILEEEAEAAAAQAELAGEQIPHRLGRGLLVAA